MRQCSNLLSDLNMSFSSPKRRRCKQVRRKFRIPPSRAQHVWSWGVLLAMHSCREQGAACLLPQAWLCRCRRSANAPCIPWPHLWHSPWHTPSGCHSPFAAGQVAQFGMLSQVSRRLLFTLFLLIERWKSWALAQTALLLQLKKRVKKC